MTTGVVDIEDRLAVVCGQLNAVHVQLVDLVVEALETDAWAVHGVRSLQHWLTWQAGVAPATAAKLIRLAEARVTHPLTSAVFADGELTLDQAALAVDVPAHCDRQMAELAPISTVAQIAIEARVARPAPEPSAEPQDDPVESVRMFHGTDGRFRLDANLDPDHGRTVEAALEAVRNRLFHDGQLQVTWVDALVAMAESSLDAQTPQRRERFRVHVFLDPDADQTGVWGDGTTVPDWLARLLSCAGTVSPTFLADGRAVNVGRTQRVVPDRTRRVVVLRDRGVCRVPWCGNRHGLEIHHLQHWVDGGPTDTANLAALCRSCHRAHHKGQLGITGNADQPDGLIFTDRDGRTIDPAMRVAKPCGPPPQPVHPYRHPLGERLDPLCLHFPDPPRQHAEPAPSHAG
jgi:hypothetical protein